MKHETFINLGYKYVLIGRLLCDLFAHCYKNTATILGEQSKPLL